MVMNANGGTITYSVQVDASGAVVGIKNAESKMVNAASQAGDKSGNKLSKSFDAATIALGNIAANAVSSAMAKISQSVSSAIARVDTFNKYPKVLSNFGVSSEEAAASIKRIDESLRGLPISLNAGVAGVQDLFFATKDLGQAEKIFKSVTDAALIFTTDSTAAVDNFIYAYKQSMAQGKVSAQDFNQMNSAIPGLLDKVAESMGLNIATLKQGLSDGSVSVESFNQTLLKLDAEGSGAMGAMEQTAKDSTGGIQTAMDLLNTTITRVMGNIINTIGSENLQNAFNAIGDAIEWLGTIIANIINFIAENEVARDALLAFLITLGIVLTTAVVPAFIAWAAAMLANPITWIVLGITSLITAIILLVTHVQEVGQWFTNVFTAIGNFVNQQVTGIAQWFDNLWTGIGQGLNNIGQFFQNTFQGVWDFVTGVFSNIGDFFRGVWNTIVSIFTSVGTAVGDAVSGAFRSVVNGVLGFIEGFINGPIDVINGFIDVINGAFGAVGVNIGRISRVSLPRLASGGIVESTVGGRIIMAGEGGEDEWVVPESKMASLVDQLQDRIGGGGETINIYVDGVFATSPDERRKVAEDIMEAYNQNQKRRFANA